MRWLAITLVLVAPVARAQVSTQAAADRARVLYDEGSREYEAGHYESAARLFEQAYDLSRAPALLFNVAQAHRLRGPNGCASAFEAYREYLRLEAQAENRSEVEERIREMQTCVRALETGASRAPAVQPPSLRGPAWLGLAGLAAGLGGAGLYFAARDTYQDAERTGPHAPGTFGWWERATWTSYALMAAGGALVVAGVSWGVWRYRGPSAVEVAVGPANVVVGGRF